MAWSEKQQRYYDENKDKFRERRRSYKEKNREKVLLWARKYREKSRDKTADYYQKNKEHIKSKSRLYFAENKKRVMKRNKVYKKAWKLDKKTELAGRPKPEICESCFEKKPRICFDHCHTTGKFRGWICSECNSALGLLYDDPIKIRRLLEYLFKSLRIAA